MGNKKRRKKICIFLLVLLAGALAGGAAIALADGTMAGPPDASGAVFPTNASGETYGSLLDVSVPGTEPDLVKAMGVDGTVGYVRYSDLNGPEPKTWAEAADQAKQAAATKRIPLYKEDGRTVIGEFEMGPGESEIKTMDDVRAE